MARPHIVVEPVRTPDQLEQFRMITRAYLEWLGEDLSFQQIEAELAGLPGSYGADRRGAMCLAFCPANAATVAAAAASIPGSSSTDGSRTDASDSSISSSLQASSQQAGGLQCIGAVALRSLEGQAPAVPPGGCVAGHPLQQVCEMKRLFVLPGRHGLGAGAALVRALLQAARQLGFKAMVLDTLNRLAGANRLYARLGFQPCQRYNRCPLAGVLYFARQLEGLPEA